MDNTNNVNDIVPTDAAPVVDAPVAPVVRNRKPAKPAPVVRDMKTLVRFAKTVTSANFDACIATVNRNHGVTHGARNVGRFTGRRIMDFQNETLRDNATWQLSDVALLFVWRAEFPAAVGRVFTGDVVTGAKIVSDVRTDYNRAPGHHAAKFVPPAESVRYARGIVPAASTSKTKTA